MAARTLWSCSFVSMLCNRLEVMLQRFIQRNIVSPKSHFTVRDLPEKAKFAFHSLRKIKVVCRHVSLSPLGWYQKITSHIVSFYFNILLYDYRKRATLSAHCLARTSFDFAFLAHQSIYWQCFNRVSFRHAPNWKMNFSSKHHQKSLKTVTQVCENKFLYYK